MNTLGTGKFDSFIEIIHLSRLKIHCIYYVGTVKNYSFIEYTFNEVLGSSVHVFVSLFYYRVIFVF